MPINRTELMIGIWRYSHIGFMLGALSVGGFFLGRWIDSFIWNFPGFAILFFFLGFGLGFYRFILLLMEDKERKKKKGGTPPHLNR